jgi:hypothetical protein
MIHKALRLTGDTRNSGPLTEHDGGTVNGVSGALSRQRVICLVRRDSREYQEQLFRAKVDLASFLTSHCGSSRSV